MNIQSYLSEGIKKVENYKMIYFLTRGFRRWKNGISYDMGIGHALFIKGCANYRQQIYLVLCVYL